MLGASIVFNTQTLAPMLKVSRIVVFSNFSTFSFFV
jgi:hypothetical protein